jgi:hypothetical protein
MATETKIISQEEIDNLNLKTLKSYEPMDWSNEPYKIFENYGRIVVFEKHSKYSYSVIYTLPYSNEIYSNTDVSKQELQMLFYYSRCELPDYLNINKNFMNTEDMIITSDMFYNYIVYIYKICSCHGLCSCHGNFIKHEVKKINCGCHKRRVCSTCYGSCICHDYVGDQLRPALACGCGMGSNLLLRLFNQFMWK